MVLIISAHFLSTHVSVPMRLLFKHLQVHYHDMRFQFSLNVRSVQITGGRMLVQLKRHLRGLQLPFQSLSPSQYVQVLSRYKIASHQPPFNCCRMLHYHTWSIQFHIFVSGSTPMSTSWWNIRRTSGWLRWAWMIPGSVIWGPLCAT